MNPNPRNPNRMNEDDKTRMRASLKEFGDLGGIVINRRTNMLVGGHQRASVLDSGELVVKDLAKPEPDGTVARGYLKHEGRRYAVRVVDWDEKKANAAMLAANRFARVGYDDSESLKGIIDELLAEDYAMDVTGYTLESIEELRLSEVEAPDDQYTRKIEAPIYKPSKNPPKVGELLDTTKADELKRGIKKAKLPEPVAEFLRYAADRHIKFNFALIADYYASAPAEVQDLMEKSALVIIDFDKAIENGFVKMSEKLADLAGLEDADAD